MSFVLAHKVRLVAMDCCQCGIVFAMPESMDQKFQEKGGTFYCPNGHSQHYTKSENDKLREKLNAQVRIATEQAQRAAAAEREVNRLKRSAAAGKCPCCRRSFKALHQHMKRQHPEFFDKQRLKKT